jgi:hypothetical protein
MTRFRTSEESPLDWVGRRLFRRAARRGARLTTLAAVGLGRSAISMARCRSTTRSALPGYQPGCALLDWKPRTALQPGLQRTIAYFDRLLSDTRRRATRNRPLMIKVITRWPRRCGRMLTRPRSPMTAWAGCSHRARPQRHYAIAKGRRSEILTRIL